MNNKRQKKVKHKTIWNREKWSSRWTTPYWFIPTNYFLLFDNSGYPIYKLMTMIECSVTYLQLSRFPHIISIHIHIIYILVLTKWSCSPFHQHCQQNAFTKFTLCILFILFYLLYMNIISTQMAWPLQTCCCRYSCFLRVERKANANLLCTVDDTPKVTHP